MIKIAVCDDEQHFVTQIKNILVEYGKKNQTDISVSEFHDGVMLLDQYDCSYDIIFLDIKMPHIDGVKVAEKIRVRDPNVTIIFLTSLFQRAVDGYRVRASNFLIKPVSEKKLTKEIDRWIETNREKKQECLLVDNMTGRFMIPISSLRYIETAGEAMNVVLDIVFTLIEGCCLLYLVKNEKIDYRRQVLFVLFYIFIIFGLTQMFTLSEMAIKMVFTTVSVIILGAFILGLSMKKSIFYMIIGGFLIMSSELLVTNIGLLFQINPGLKEDASISNIHIIISKIVCITLLVTVQKIISDVSRERFDIKILFFFVCSNIGYIVVGSFILANILYTEGEAYSNMLLVCSVVLLFTFIINVFFSNKYSRIENEAQQQRMEIYKLETQTRYYKEKMRDEERIKEIYHDMKNHLLLLEEEWGEKNSTGIENLRKEMEQYENYYRTGNKFVDIILKDKFAKAAEYGINIEDRVELIDIDFIEPLDLSTVFGNLLDNAIEACRLIEEPEKRHVSISSKREHNLLVISIKNNKVCGNIKNVPKKVIHGYGLSNVTAAVHKYGGEIDIMEGEQEFVVNIVMPIKKGEEFA